MMLNFEMYSSVSFFVYFKIYILPFLIGLRVAHNKEECRVLDEQTLDIIKPAWRASTKQW